MPHLFDNDEEKSTKRGKGRSEASLVSTKPKRAKAVNVLCSSQARSIIGFDLKSTAQACTIDCLYHGSSAGSPR